MSSDGVTAGHIDIVLTDFLMALGESDGFVHSGSSTLGESAMVMQQRFFIAGSQGSPCTAV